MGDIRFRFACPDDAGALANAHWLSASRQPGGFMCRLGKRFLLRYWQAILRERHAVILCAEGPDGEFLGFASGTIDAEERQRTLKRHRIELAFAALPAIVRDPGLVREISARESSGSADRGEGGYVVKSGAREDYWAWAPGKGGAMELQVKWLKVMKLLGVDTVRGEIDKVNDLVVKAHKILGARVIREFVTPDGKERFLIEYRLGPGTASR